MEKMCTMHDGGDPSCSDAAASRCIVNGQGAKDFEDHIDPIQYDAMIMRINKCQSVDTLINEWHKLVEN